MNEQCPSCGADIGPSEHFPWHLDREDCRAIHEPVETVVKEYLTTALWAETDEEGDPLNDAYTVADIDPESVGFARYDVAAFWATNREAIDALHALGFEDGQIAHDFWLTRNRHGAGFWDGDYPEPHASTLTDSAHAFGEQDMYPGDDGISLSQTQLRRSVLGVAS